MGDERDLKLGVLKLNNENYVVWKWQFQNILKAKGLSIVLSEGEEVTSEQDAQALALLGSSLSDENILKIIDCDTFGKAWISLQRCFENKTTYQPQALFRKLNSIQIESAEKVSQGIGEIRGIVAQLKNLGETVSDNLVIGAVLAALPASFEVFSTVWKNTACKDIDGLIEKVLAEASDQVGKGDSGQALVARQKQRTKELQKDECRYCHEIGHYIKDCPKLPTPYDPNFRRNRGNQQEEENKNGTEKKGDGKKDQGDKSFALLAVKSEIKLSSNVWVADSGATHHMSPHKSIFTNMQPASINKQVGTADKVTTMTVEGVGEVDVGKGVLKNVLFVPQLKQNLFSLSAAAKNGVTYSGTATDIKFFVNERQVFEAKLSGKLYLIEFEMALASVVTLEEWHARLGHVSIPTIEMMAKNQIVKDLKISSAINKRCEDCIMNKCKRAEHKLRSTTKSVTAGQVLHLDTAGPSKVESIGKSKYFVICKDEASNYKQVTFTATKDAIPDMIKEMITRAQLETKNKTMKIVTDNGTEFVNINLTNFLKEKGIIHEKSASYTPQQNGFVEREIRTVKEAARTIMNAAKVNATFWAEAINTSCYILNRVVVGNEKTTPYEKWFGEKPSVGNLRIFGEVAIVLKNEKNKTWTEKGERGMFLGYTERFNNYRIYLNGKVIITCNCTFVNKWFSDELKDEPVIKQQWNEIWVTSNKPGNDMDISNYHESLESGNNDYESSGEVQGEQEQTEPNQSDQGTYENQNESPTIENVQEEPYQPSTSGNTHIRKSNIPTAVVTRTNDRRAIENLINLNKDKSIQINHGEQAYNLKVGDLLFQESTGRWRNKNTGHFVAQNDISRIAEFLSEREQTNVSVALISEVLEVPKNYKEAIRSEQKEKWIEAMNEEMGALIRKNVFVSINIQEGKKRAVGSRWVYSLKYKANGDIDKFKARVVAKGFNQRYGIDYLDTYCHVISIMSTRLILNFAAMEKLKMRQFDIKTAFLNADLDDEILVEIPEGFEEKGKIWLLKKSLYGLKQSPRKWNECFGKFLEGSGLQSSFYDKSLYFRKQPMLIVLVYVDDGLVFARQEIEINIFMSHLGNKFDMREMTVNKYRGLEIKSLKNGIFIHQKGYVEEILDTFNMSEAKTMPNPVIFEAGGLETLLDEKTPFMNVVGSLAFLADTTRPDIAFAVNQLAQKLHQPTSCDWSKAKHVLRYIAGSKELGILYHSEKKEGPLLTGYSDADFAGCTLSSKSTTGWVINFNSAIVHWKCRKQKHVTLNSTEAEIISLCSLAKELTWIRKMIIEVNIRLNDITVLRCDNESALKISLSEKATKRTRHLRAQDAYIREQVKLKELNVEHVNAKDQLADILTKRVPTPQFITNRDKILS